MSPLLRCELPGGPSGRGTRARLGHGRRSDRPLAVSAPIRRLHRRRQSRRVRCREERWDGHRSDRCALHRRAPLFDDLRRIPEAGRWFPMFAADSGGCRCVLRVATGTADAQGAWRVRQGRRDLARRALVGGTCSDRRQHQHGNAGGAASPKFAGRSWHALSVHSDGIGWWAAGTQESAPDATVYRNCVARPPPGVAFGLGRRKRSPLAQATPRTRPLRCRPVSTRLADRKPAGRTGPPVWRRGSGESGVRKASQP